MLVFSLKILDPYSYQQYGHDHQIEENVSPVHYQHTLLHDKKMQDHYNHKTQDLRVEVLHERLNDHMMPVQQQYAECLLPHYDTLLV